MKATPPTIASNSNDISTASVSKAGDVMMTSSSQKEGILKKNSILPRKDLPEGRTTTIVAVRPKHGHHHQHSNKHYKKKLVRVLLNSGSDGNLVFVDKDKPMLVLSSKRQVPQSWNTSNGMFQTKWKAEIELNFFKYSNNKRYLVKPDIVGYDKNNKPQYDLILGVKTMKKYGIILDFKDKMITVDEVKLPMQNINYLQGSSTLRVLRLNHSLAMELYQLILNISIFEVRARPSSYIRIYGSFEEPYIQIYGFLWSFCNGFSQPMFDIAGLEFP
jgi:hypothetical protein